MTDTVLDVEVGPDEVLPKQQKGFPVQCIAISFILVALGLLLFNAYIVSDNCICSANISVGINIFTIITYQ